MTPEQVRSRLRITWASVVLAAVLAGGFGAWAMRAQAEPQRGVGCCTRVDVLEYHIREAISLLDAGENRKARGILSAQLDEE